MNKTVGGEMTVNEVKSTVKSMETDNYNTQAPSSAKATPGAGGVNSASGSVSAGWKPCFGSGKK
jgi:hypothetical protein